MFAQIFSIRTTVSLSIYSTDPDCMKLNYQNKEMITVRKSNVPSLNTNAHDSTICDH